MSRATLACDGSLKIIYHLFYVRYADPAQSISSFLGHHLPGDRYVTGWKDHGLDWEAKLWSAKFAVQREVHAFDGRADRTFEFQVLDQASRIYLEILRCT